MKITFLDTTHMLYGNKGAVCSNTFHICEVGLSSSTLCGVPMLSTNWASLVENAKPGCLKCRLLYTLKSVSREDLIKVCKRNDPNGVYLDEHCKKEGMPPATKDDLTIIIMMWVIEEQMTESEINDLLKPYAKI